MGLVFRAECRTTPALSFATVIFTVSEHFVSYVLIIPALGRLKIRLLATRLPIVAGTLIATRSHLSDASFRLLAPIGNKIGEPTPSGIPYLAHPLLFS
jgi:hypothetical protein